MPRYFIDTFDHMDTLDQEGTVLPDQSALRGLLRTALTDILGDEGGRQGVNEYTATARDESGRLVMRARTNLTITEQ